MMTIFHLSDCGTIRWYSIENHTIFHSLSYALWSPKRQMLFLSNDWIQATNFFKAACQAVIRSHQNENSPSFPKTKQNEKNAQKQKKSHEKSPPPILVRGDTNGKVITCSKVQAARRERTRCILYKCANTLPFVSHSSSFPSTKTSCYRRGKELYGHHANTSKCGRQG